MIKKLINYKNENDLNLLKNFIDKNKSDNFRYYENRSFESLKNHLITVLFFNNEEVLGYGHLDNENNATWLGIIISEKFRGQGYGKKIMQELINFHDGPIQLSVDKSNHNAVKLYTKLNFNIIEENDKIFIMKLTK